MPITQSITVLPTPPSRADPENFDTRADAFLGALPTMQTQMNTWAGQANQTALDIGIVSEGLTSTTAGANKVPLADANGKIDTAWLKVGTGSGEVAAGTNGVTNGDSHDHNGGDGAQIAYSSLSGLPTLGTAAAAATTDFTSASFLQSGTGAVSRTTISKLRDVVNVRDFGAVGDGITNDQAAFQAAVTYLASVGCGVLEFDGVFKIDTPVTGISSNMTITGKGVSKIINGITSVQGTTDALFTGSGALTDVGTITADLAENSDSVTVSTPANFAVGDVICFTGDYVGRNISIVTKITDSVLSLDRSACNAIASGSTIWKMSPLRNTVIGNFDIDFNGTTASPRYGFGVVLQNSKDCRIENINSKFIGSKVAEISGGVDCVISNVNCSYGTDLAGEGGHSYLIRLSVCNDCLVEKCVGNYVRHTVDLSGASHNVVRDCQANGNYSTSFLSHGNNCKYNSFKNCTSVRSTTSGYEFDSAGGDTGNVIDGCATDDEGFFYSEGDGSNTVKNTVFKTTGVYALSFTGKQVFNNCTFYSSYPLISYQNADTEFTFINCKFVLSGDKALGSLYSNTSTIRLTFINCDIDCSAYEAGTHFAGGSNTYLTFMGCAVTGAERDSSDYPLFSGVTKEINAYDSTFRFLGAGGYYFFGAESGTKITISNNRFINADYIIRRYTSADCSIVFGQNQFINSTLVSLANFIGLSTIGAVDILLNAVPSTGTWIAGSKILFSTPAVGGDTGAVCTTAGTPGTWKTFGEQIAYSSLYGLPSVGKILQVVAGTSTTEVTVASGTYTDIGLSVTITPRDANSKILLLASFEVYVYASYGGTVGAHTKLLRGASVVQEKLWSPWARYESLIMTVAYAVLDSPATASAITYKLQGKVSDYVSGMSVSFMDSGSPGSLIALEVAG